jgi:hypothetical protein
MALTAIQTLHNQMKDFVAQQISTELSRLLDRHKTKIASDGKQKGKFQHQDWMFIPSKNKTISRQSIIRVTSGASNVIKEKDNG